MTTEANSRMKVKQSEIEANTFTFLLLVQECETHKGCSLVKKVFVFNHHTFYVSCCELLCLVENCSTVHKPRDNQYVAQEQQHFHPRTLNIVEFYLLNKCVWLTCGIILGDVERC